MVKRDSITGSCYRPSHTAVNRACHPLGTILPKPGKPIGGPHPQLSWRLTDPRRRTSRSAQADACLHQPPSTAQKARLAVDCAVDSALLPRRAQRLRLGHWHDPTPHSAGSAANPVALAPRNTRSVDLCVARITSGWVNGKSSVGPWPGGARRRAHTAPRASVAQSSASALAGALRWAESVLRPGAFWDGQSSRSPKQGVTSWTTPVAPQSES